MSKLDFMQIDATPANVAEMMTRGQFHAHQDGRWRFSPYDAAAAKATADYRRTVARAYRRLNTQAQVA